MNTNSPSPATLSGNSGINSTLREAGTESPVRLLRLLLSLAIIVGMFDLCFWGVQSLGFSMAVFFPMLTGIILANKNSFPWKRTTRFLLILLIGGVISAAIEVGVTNTFVLFILIVALAGDTFFGNVESFSGRWLSQGIALVRAPGRVFWLGATLLESGFDEGLGWIGSFLGGCLLVVPALVLTLIFGFLLTSGNAVFGNWTNTFFSSLWKMVEFYFDFWRIFLWFFIAFLALPLIRPVNVSSWWWSWTQHLPRFKERVPVRAAMMSSGLILIVLNMLFLVANIADILFLWSGRELPSGVNYSQFVHQGVNSLIVTVLLSAVVLTIIFQQALSIAQRHELKLLALVWIAQNLFLILSVGLRLKLYIEAYDMTVARLGVIIFLMLVACGYGLLGVKIVKDRSLSWLIGGCLLAIFATFYITQFFDLEGWSANYNVARWEKDRSRRLDVCYLTQMGAPAWPALRHAHDIDETNSEINEGLKEARCGLLYSVETGFEWRYWREFGFRAWMNRAALEEKQNN